MKPLAIYILLMLNNMPAVAQSKKVISIEWKTIAELPPFRDQSKSIGVAGPVIIPAPNCSIRNHPGRS
jgi:hypothetical protein